MTDLAEIAVAVLAGGPGTRLRPVVPDRPKALAAVAGQPFVTVLLDRLAAAGCGAVVLCTGYLGERVWAALGESYRGLRLSYSQELEPLGTAGALRLALPRLASDPVLVLNGDSCCDADLGRFLAWHRERAAEATLLLTEAAETGRYGRVQVDATGAVVRFEEKRPDGGPGWINAGVYLLGRSFLQGIPPRRAMSLEREVFPAWVGRGLCGYRQRGWFLDIGTPEAYAEAQAFFAPREVAANP